ncbi:aminotransferase class V-fold PLP-dependent enzyme [Natronorubrum sp. JWXQ-INN-674]|uniref:Aminotransferase class V-fold PLP-dependent enzyme n=1 Tax=Natronorubrum halalkaliphilum TaxID=2691917 RepID=A0A6B0VFC8_9EURY|nr:aminotransferase class V-fold PLP-dependent enzyme [Natronorubrum halalkaliphilum]MXV60481.1 aminotransferase class V-fold PLP-dependent enzyme [Natronorubrum halalkaliphilum]
MTDSIYEEIGVSPVINATGTKTRIGGSRIRPEAADAMQRAADGFARISDLQARASTLIQDATGAEAGYVCSGASACLTMAAAAAIAGTDLEAMAQLPDTDGLADEIVIPRTHRSGYDHAYRVAGASIVDVGTNDAHLGTGSVNTEPWEIDRAISEETAAVAYMQKSYTDPPLETVVEIAHDHDVPVIVDAAAELPPVTNLNRFVDLGVDLVAFSGGKAIRGPQTTGILAGREDLIRSVAAQHLDMHAAEPAWTPPSSLLDVEELGGVPRQGIGRGMKVGKEELVGLITALTAFLEDDHDENATVWRARSERIAQELAESPGVETRLTAAEKTSVAPEVVVSVDASVADSSAVDIVRGLRTEHPRIYVGADDLDADALTINPMCLTDDEAEYVLERLRTYL